MIQFRRTKEGAWAAFGPQIELDIGRVKVIKKGGEIVEVTVRALSTPFLVDGIPHCFGYLEDKSEENGKGGGRKGPRKRCWECGCSFTYSECKENDGDWSDSYCGC